MKFCGTVLLFVLSVSTTSVVDAQVIYGSAMNYSTGYSAYPVATNVVATPTVYPVTTVQQSFSHASTGAFSPNMASTGLAQQKASQAANMGLRGHLGGGLGNARYEGVGWSNQSSQAAIENCCYWGTRPVSQIGVSRGHDGCWYACVLYQ